MMSNSQIQINGQIYDASDLALPARKWRDAFNPPVDGVVAVDAARKQAILEGMVKAECGKRIFAVADQNTQMNLAAAAAAGLLSTADMDTFKVSLGWVAQMRTNVTTLVAADDEDFANDSKWPAVPVGVQTLADQY